MSGISQNTPSAVTALAEDFYNIPEVKFMATQKQVEASYKRLADQFNPNKETSFQHWAAIKSKQFEAAYNTLGNKKKRAAYDTVYALYFANKEKMAQEEKDSAEETYKEKEKLARKANMKAHLEFKDWREGEIVKVQKEQSKEVQEETATVGPENNFGLWTYGSGGTDINAQSTRRHRFGKKPESAKVQDAAVLAQLDREQEAANTWIDMMMIDLEE